VPGDIVSAVIALNAAWMVISSPSSRGLLPHRPLDSI
jgi:hypothetical protein